jgi:hypothetical protein
MHAHCLLHSVYCYMLQALPADCGMRDLLAFTSECSELSYSLRRSEKKQLNDMNKTVRW